jgi:hypothetical protein
LRDADGEAGEAGVVAGEREVCGAAPGRVWASALSSLSLDLAEDNFDANPKRIPARFLEACIGGTMRPVATGDYLPSTKLLVETPRINGVPIAGSCVREESHQVTGAMLPALAGVAEAALPENLGNALGNALAKVAENDVWTDGEPHLLQIQRIHLIHPNGGMRDLFVLGLDGKEAYSPLEP